ncbi:MAG: hypothetical protein ABII18_11375, partial [bacterium]
EFKTNYKRISVRTVDGTSIVGKINIEDLNRVSDIFKGTEPDFIVLTDATHHGGDNKTLFINRDHIVWVEPEE